jgi:ribosome-binding protein aMBF1 (putative translation factor)
MARQTLMVCDLCGSTHEVQTIKLYKTSDNGWPAYFAHMDMCSNCVTIRATPKRTYPKQSERWTEVRRQTASENIKLGNGKRKVTRHKDATANA